ncbi:MAG: ABC transporter permease, partial [Pseudomonadota bacterium]
MSWFRLALANLGLSKLTSAVNVLLMALGTASIVILLLVGAQVSDTMSRDAEGVDLVIGAKGSPVQLVLSAVYHADVPTGNIALADANIWANDTRIAEAIPLSLGDSYRGFRIVGTTPDYAALYDASIAEGEWWQRRMQAVVGAAVAARANLSVGSTFVGAHGFSDAGHSHDEDQYRVVGILERTGSVLDRLVLTSLDSVWAIHEPGGTSDNEDAHEHGDEDHDDEHDHEAHEHDEEDHDDEHDHEAHEHDEEDHDDEHDLRRRAHVRLGCPKCRQVHVSPTHCRATSIPGDPARCPYVQEHRR